MSFSGAERASPRQGRDASASGGKDAQPGRVCLACGTVGPPDDEFCTNCGRALPPPTEARRPTVFGRAFGSGPRSGDPTDAPRYPIWLFGVAIGVGIILVAFVAVNLLSRHGSSGPARVPGVPFDGNGYSIALPYEYPWVHVSATDGDEWHFQPVGAPGMGIDATIVADLQPAEQTLEGALGRMESQTPPARRPFTGSPESLALPAGSVYRVVDSSGFDTYVFFKGGRAIFLEFEHVARADEDAVAASVAFK